jgi:hypothetical protein
MLSRCSAIGHLTAINVGSRMTAGLNRVQAEGKKTFGRPKIGSKVEEAICGSSGGAKIVVETANWMQVRTHLPSWGRWSYILG